MEDFNKILVTKEHQTQALKKSNPVVHGGDKWQHQSGVGEIPWNSSTIAINIVDEKENSLQMPKQLEPSLELWTIKRQNLALTVLVQKITKNKIK